MKAVVVALLAGLMAGQCQAGLVGSNRCQWGPAYWCANIQQAKECDAVTHCIKAVWEKETVPEDTDEVCDICKDMVGQARDTLQSNETQEELKEVFDGSCDLIPLKPVSSECKVLADQFVPELVETLASQMNPDTVCTVAGLCNSKRIDAMLDARTNQVCSSCRSEMTGIQQQLAMVSDKQIEMQLLLACQYMDSYSDSCMYTVGTKSKVLIEMLREGLSPRICDNEDVCRQLSSSTNSNPADDIQCEFCSKVVKHWIDVYASKQSLEEFKEMLDGICDKIDSKNAVHCKHIVDDYYMPLFEYVRRLNPHAVCSFVGLCNNNGQGLLAGVNSQIPITTLLRQPETEPETAMVPLLQAQQTVSEKPSCVFCEYVVTQLKTYLKDGQTEEEIKEYVDEICTKLPSSLRGQCTKFVDTYEPLLVDLLVNDLEPSQVCKEIKLCDAQNYYLQAVDKGANCETCQFVMEEVFSVISDKDDSEMVVNVLESICYRLPASIDLPCENFVDKYTPLVLDVIANSLSPDQVCRALDLCQDDELIEEDDDQVEDVADTGCILCEYVISNLDKMLSDKNTEEEVKQALEEVCDILPKSVSKECDQFVETYTDIVIQMLTGEITPEEACTYLQLCKKATTDTNIITQPDIDETKGPYCTLCEYAITEVDNMLKDDATEKEIEEALDIVCYQLTAPVHKQCVKMVEKYTKEIISMLANDYTPASVCSELSLCVNQEISSNDVHAIDFPESEEDDDDDEDDEYDDEDDEENDDSEDDSEDKDISNDGLGCVMCEFAMEVVDEHLDDAPTVDQVERVVQYMCSYLPESIAEECEQFVDDNGQKIIDALVKDQLNPRQVCTLSLNLCDGFVESQRRQCGFGPSMWCSTPYHTKLCDAQQFCQVSQVNLPYINF